MRAELWGSATMGSQDARSDPQSKQMGCADFLLKHTEPRALAVISTVLLSS